VLISSYLSVSVRVKNHKSPSNSTSCNCMGRATNRFSELCVTSIATFASLRIDFKAAKVSGVFVMKNSSFVNINNFPLYFLNKRIQYKSARILIFYVEESNPLKETVFHSNENGLVL